MAVSILMSGPIRPSPEEVLLVIWTLRAQLPTARVFLCTWDRFSIPTELREAVDSLTLIPEPTQAEIDDRVTAKTLQQRECQPNLDHWTYGIYRMIHGVQAVCAAASTILPDDAPVIRIRTDTPIVFAPGALEQELARLGDEYIIRWRQSNDGVFFDDWFALTRLRILRETWTFEDYNASIDAAWNVETLIRNNLRVPLRHFSRESLETYILRPNGQTTHHV